MSAIATISLSQATYLDANAPTTVRNDGYPRYVGAVAAENRSPFTFVMPAAPHPNAVISKIEFFLYAAERGGAAFNTQCFALRRSDWLQSQASWNVFKTGNNWGTAGAKNTSTDYINTVIDQAQTPAVNNWYSLILQGTGADNPLALNWGDTFHGILAGDVVSAGRYCGHNPGGGGQNPYLEITYEITPSTNYLTNYRIRKRVGGSVSV